MEIAWTIHQKPIEKGDASLGLGWHLTPDGTHWHNGQTGGYHTMILVNRTSKTSVVLMTNTSTGEVDQLATDILKMLSGVMVAPRKFEKPLDVPAESLQKFVGHYELAPGVLFTVEALDGKLMIGLTGQETPRGLISWMIWNVAIDVRPVFVEHFRRCHGEKKQWARLRSPNMFGDSRRNEHMDRS
jgi:D-alanyl-D-alanine-carboxypeptidase/D-alanyl-D-alanine-endopeptidase